MATSKVKLAIIDDYSGIASDVFAPLSNRVEITAFPDTLDVNIPEQKARQIKRLQPFTIISTMRERTAFPADVIEALPNLKLILGTGMRNSLIDMKACSDHGVLVVGAHGHGNSPAPDTPTSIHSTYELAWALILGLQRNLARDDLAVKSGGWQGSAGIGLKGKTLGILGLGKLGSEVAKIGVLGFGMKVLTWSRNLTQEIADQRGAALGVQAGAFKVASSKAELLKNADVVSLHFILSKDTIDLLGSAELDLIKPSAILVNTSRGALVNEKALLAALKQGKFRGAALDVYEKEPLPLDSEWRTTKWGQEGRSEVLLSPHMGFVEEGVIRRWYEDSANNAEVWLDGKIPATKLN